MVQMAVLISVCVLCYACRASPGACKCLLHHFIMVHTIVFSNNCVATVLAPPPNTAVPINTEFFCFM